jgi:hypothetical protein
VLTRHIDHLESVRKHLMQRMDSELQLIRSQTSLHQSAAQAQNPRATSNAESELTMQRILARLSRIESKLDAG